MNFDTFSDLIAGASDPVVIIEGRRSIAPELAESARELAAFLANRFPHLRFRSGNAVGSDEAFTLGVLEVAPERLQVMTPYASHREKQRHPLAHYISPESLDPEELESIQAMTIAATPKNKGLVNCYQKGGRLGSQAACLIRDTMKVAGVAGTFKRPTVGLFCVDPSNPEAGGTGHTIRVCRNAGIPVVLQACWETWLAQ